MQTIKINGTDKSEKIAVIDCTPTWSEMCAPIEALLVDGNAEGRATARAELHRMASLADAYVKERKAGKIGKPYFTLLSKQKGATTWAIEFGDFSKLCVQDERDDMKSSAERGTKFKIVQTDGTQSAIESTVQELNAKEQQGS